MRSSARAVISDPRFTGQVVFISAILLTLTLGDDTFTTIEKAVLSVVWLFVACGIAFVAGSYAYPRTMVPKREAGRVRALLIACSALWIIGYLVYRWM